jgi:hypothetical protein
LAQHDEPEAVLIRDEDGIEVAGDPDVRRSLVVSAQAEELILDGYLVQLPRRDTAGWFVDQTVAAVPGLAATTRQLMLGGLGGVNGAGAGRGGVGGRGGAAGVGAAAGADVAAGAGAARDSVGDGLTHRPAGGRTVSAFVAVDLLLADQDLLFDAPLLERKRLLDAVLTIGEHVRRGPHVRPPAENWYGQWRSLGFGEVAVKAANGRYLPGQRSPDWAIAPIPRS